MNHRLRERADDPLCTTSDYKILYRILPPKCPCTNYIAAYGVLKNEVVKEGRPNGHMKKALRVSNRVAWQIEKTAET